MELEKTFCCFCCRSGPLSARISIPASGFVPGQTIPITAEVINASNVRVNQLNIVLCKVVTFKVQTRTTQKTTIDKIVSVCVGLEEVRDIQRKQLKIEIPQLFISNLTNCKLIDLDYELQVSIKYVLHKQHNILILICFILYADRISSTRCTY